MNGILLAAIIIGCTGLLIGLLLGIAGKKFAVEIDEKEAAVREQLPGNNCGGCGYAGCDALAKAIAAKEAAVGACPVGGAPVAEKIAAIMGVSAGAGEKQVAFVKCSGTCDKTERKANYYGVDDCRKAAVIPGKSDKKCAFGCMGLGACVNACNFDAIYSADYHAPQLLNYKMAEYAKAVIDGRPHFHISLVLDISPNCDCHPENDAPILPNIGMFVSKDPLALDQACVDACLAATPMPGSQLYDRMQRPDFHDHHDHFKNSTPESEYQSCLEHAAKIGIGTREYELIK